MKISLVEQRSDEWFKLRLGLFTGSNVWKLIGKMNIKKIEGKKTLVLPTTLTQGAKTYVMQKVNEIVRNERKPTPTTDDMQWGIDNEVDAIIEYRNKFKEFTIPVGFYYNENYGCSPDQLVDPLGALEIKCGPVKHLNYCLLKTQEDIYKKEKELFWQCQMIMLCAKRQWVDFVAFDPRLEGEYNHLRLHVVRIKRKDHIMKRLINGLKLAIAYKLELKKQLGI